MTSKEAVNLLKQHFYWKVEGKEKALEILEELAERDTPKKIEYENNGIPYCAVCERSYLRDVRGNQNRFCGYCGQKLDWGK